MPQEPQDRTLSGKAYRLLLGDIVSGALAPCAKLKLDELGTRYGVGLAPLREALARLVGELLVTAEGQRGFWVAPLSFLELRDVTRLRALIETEALQDSIRLGGKDWEAGVRQAFAALSAVEQDILDKAENAGFPLFDQWEACNARFHSALISACGSPTFMEFRAGLYRRAERYRRIVRVFDREVHEEHVAIFEASVHRNILRACRLTELHLASRTEGIARHGAGRQDWS